MPVPLQKARKFGLDSGLPRWHESVPAKMHPHESSIDSETPIERNCAAQAKRGGAVVVALCASAIPISYLAYFIYSFGSALPVNDQWDTAPFLVSLKEGNLDWRLLFHFHNEHLIVIPRLLFALLLLLFTWDNRAECWLTFLLVVSTFGLLCRVVLKGRDNREMMSAVALVVISGFMFSTTQWQNWLWGFQVAWPIPVLALTAAVPALYHDRSNTASAIAILAATTVAMLSMGNGFLVPLILCAILVFRYLRSRRPHTLFLLSICSCLVVACIGLFFMGKPATAGHVHLGLVSLQSIAIILGNPYLDATTTAPNSFSLFLIAATAISVFLIVFFIWFSWRGYATDLFESPLFSTGFALATWSLLSAFTIALARGASGFEAVAQSRYISYAVLLPVGLLLMAVALSRTGDLRARGAGFYRAWIFVAVGLAAFPLRREPSRLQWGRDMREVYSTLSEFLKVAPAFPIDAELQKICPQNNRVAIIETVARKRLIRGMVPPGTHVPGPMVQMRAPIGNIDAIVKTESGSDLIGWCAFLDARWIPDAVFLGAPNPDGSVELLAPILHYHDRPDVAARGGSLQSGWRLHLPPEHAGIPITLLAYDWATNKFYRGPGEKRL